ncbi:hypothetical protein D7D52_03405 [Nocardia yunnanensis]|uniref:Uncharacterized protein n=1 Tax=Nocardia yunnanensis TaxID=2382165 RepID=A0A386Z601_9NOCA|nr:hypothetical protein [Nocardia yunnanensis]AYF73070.1 hypothetical protein D7D52_03405 [Nocardia yunnanensis]
MRPTNCALCESALDHCHGTLIAHAAGTVECTDSDCFDTGRARHLFVADCGDVAGGCTCAAPVVQTGRHDVAG